VATEAILQPHLDPSYVRSSEPEFSLPQNRNSPDWIQGRAGYKIKERSHKRVSADEPTS
jgi:hypothetical protein